MHGKRRQHLDRLIERTSRTNAQCTGQTREGRRCRRTAPDGIQCPRHGGAKRSEVQPTRAGLPPIRLHDLRHTAASLTYRATRDLKLVSELLGHSGIQITGDIYTIVFAEVDKAAAAAVAAMVPRKPRPSVADLSGASSAAPCPPRAHMRPKRAEERAAARAKPQVNTAWGGWDSNPRPRDYESPALTG